MNPLLRICEGYKTDSLITLCSRNNLKFLAPNQTAIHPTIHTTSLLNPLDKLPIFRIFNSTMLTVDECSTLFSNYLTKRATLNPTWMFHQPYMPPMPPMPPIPPPIPGMSSFSSLLKSATTASVVVMRDETLQRAPKTDQIWNRNHFPVSPSEPGQLDQCQKTPIRSC